MEKRTLYQKNQAGEVKIWTIEVIEENGQAGISTTAGLLTGAHTPNIVWISAGKGKKTIYEQAVSEANSKYTKKMKEGYVEDINDAKLPCELGSGVKSPMLAQKFDPTGKQNGSKTLKEIGIEGKLVGTQDKKDGNRLSLKIWRDTVSSPTQVGLYSRKGEKFPSLPHIEEQAIAAFDKIFDYVNGKYGILEYTVDGELYVSQDVMSFNKLNGLVKRQADKRTEAEWDLINQVEYHVYDVWMDAPYTTRDKVKDYFKGTHLKPLHTNYVIATNEALEALLLDALERGEEGLMIRQLDKPYEHKRTWQLIKYKIFQDEEFEVVSAEESIRGGQVGAMILKAPSNAFDKDGNKIETFKAAMKMSFEDRIEIWNNQQDYIGKKATIEFFGYSEYNVPRFPKCKGFRNDA